MKKLCTVDAVDAVMKRVIHTVTVDKVHAFVKHLKKYGYEKENINITTKTLYEEGDTIYITKKMVDDLPTNKYIEKNWKTVSAKERYRNDARKTIEFVFGDNPEFPIKGTLEALRLDNTNGHMVINWEGNIKREALKQTNCYMLEYIGFNIPAPEFEHIPIAEADNSLLDTSDIIVKYLIKDNNWSEERALEYLKPVLEAMNKAEAVFYQP